MERLQKEAIMLTIVKQIISLIGECSLRSLLRACFLFEDFFDHNLELEFIYIKGDIDSDDAQTYIYSMMCDFILKLETGKEGYPILVPSKNSETVEGMYSKTISLNTNRIKYVSTQIARMKHKSPNVIPPLYLMSEKPKLSECEDDKFAQYMCNLLRRISNIDLYHTDALKSIQEAKKLKRYAKLIDDESIKTIETHDTGNNYNNFLP
jgi:hypothetical protein